MRDLAGPDSGGQDLRSQKGLIKGVRRAQRGSGVARRGSEESSSDLHEHTPRGGCTVSRHGVHLLLEPRPKVNEHRPGPLITAHKGS